MLKPEEAKARLQKLTNPEWLEPHLAALGKLPAKLRNTARMLFDEKSDRVEIDADGDFQVAKEYARALEVLRTMSATERRRFFDAFFPRLGAVVERGWQLHARLPYQTEWGRKPFRAPGHDEALFERRVEWLGRIAEVTGPYAQDIVWFAAWAPHVAQWREANALGILLAAAIDDGGPVGDEVFEILCASARGEHEIGAMGRHVTRALLCAERQDGWEFVEKLLLAAQREEGLRQVILESVDEAHPQAFRRMLRLILDHDLARFSATVRAFDVWLGFQWDAVSAGVVRTGIEALLRMLDDPAARAAALAGSDAEAAYLALWASAFDDAPGTIPAAAALLAHPLAEMRYVAVHLLAGLRIEPASEPLASALDDRDLRVAHRAVRAFSPHADGCVDVADSFERLERLLPRYPRKEEPLAPIVWPWTATRIEANAVLYLLILTLGSRPPARLLAHLPLMNADSRASLAQVLGAREKWDAATRATLLKFIGDASSSVRDTAARALHARDAEPGDAAELEPLLTRTSGTLRHHVIALLWGLADPDLLASADRLLASRNAAQRLGGLEILRMLIEAKRAAGECRAKAEAWRQRHPQPSDAEQRQLDTIFATATDAPSLDDALGLLDHAQRTRVGPVVHRGVRLHSPAAREILKSLDALIDAHREDTFIECGQTYLLGNARYSFQGPNPMTPIEQDLARFAFRELWENWWRERGATLRDDDGMELVRALAQLYFLRSEELECFWKRSPGAMETLCGGAPQEMQHRTVAFAVLSWLFRIEPPPLGWVDFTLDAAETSLALVPETELFHVPDPAKSNDRRWRNYGCAVFDVWLNLAEMLRAFAPDAWSDRNDIHFWRLRRWIDEPVFDASLHRKLEEKKITWPRVHPRREELFRARAAGGATDADVIDQLLGPRHEDWFADLAWLTKRIPHPSLAQYPWLAPLVERCRARVLEVELTRGDLPTVATHAARSLNSVWGIDALVAILRALGPRNFTRGWAFHDEGKESSLSRLTRNTFPKPGETAEQFKAAVDAARVPETRLVELALYAPQWAAFVEHALGWPELAEGVWWIHAHTKGADWAVDQDLRAEWQADLSRRTELTGADLLDGAVDVAWFHRVHAALGEARWAQLYDAAKYASSGVGHTCAKLFADAMLGQVKAAELIARIRTKRHQDSVRALGLVPLAGGARREADVQARYELMQEFIRGARKFGAQRQASEKRAAQIGQENLARTAGYSDPIRLQWAMEARAIDDLADGPIAVTVEDVTVALGIDPWGDVELKVSKAGKPLGDIPAKLKKHADIARLRERRTELKKQAARIRPSLEQLMVRGDTFTAAELRELMQHPLLAPMLRGLVLVGDGVLGYPVHDGRALEDATGNIEALKPAEALRIAHPLDLLPAAQWHAWQKDCLARERIQPFKQVFRELYPLTATERAEGLQTRRYAGHQVQPRKALALLGTRGWVHHPEEGVRKTFHEAGVTAWLGFQQSFYTPAEIEGLTIDSVHFTRRGDGQLVKLDAVPARLFSEAMRDLDLVVSVAHRGGVDPEASASTLEMRASLVRETCTLLRLENVRVKEPFVIIDGKLAQYSVHLGSAGAVRLPGGALLLVPVHSQHRGRLFLPFADDDPKTAEVLSKILLLARDTEIRDPGILDQLRGG